MRFIKITILSNLNHKKYLWFANSSKKLALKFKSGIYGTPCISTVYIYARDEKRQGATVTQHTVVVQLAASDFATRFSREGYPEKRRRRAMQKERQNA